MGIVSAPTFMLLITATNEIVLSLRLNLIASKFAHVFIIFNTSSTPFSLDKWQFIFSSPTSSVFMEISESILEKGKGVMLRKQIQYFFLCLRCHEWYMKSSHRHFAPISLWTSQYSSIPPETLCIEIIPKVHKATMLSLSLIPRPRESLLYGHVGPNSGQTV